MQTHEFTIIASGLDPEAADFEDRFYEAGCGDATISIQKGAIVLDFSREAKTFISAVITAIRDVMKAGARAERIEPDNLVSTSEIASRASLTRSAVSHYTTGKRGSNFPPPVARVTTESPLWDWAEVAHWMYRHDLDFSLVRVVKAKIVRDANVLVEVYAQGAVSGHSMRVSGPLMKVAKKITQPSGKPASTSSGTTKRYEPRQRVAASH
ncbi:MULTISPECIES: hypothetical protein [Hyphomicrobiales]|uniref:hypothetical protein n=1 Tax=Hyphomicrobiales TaxID=356 RepID=UPI001BD039C0|nr:MULTISPECIES: hypothetical protein [Hyphomicrobiales]CAH1662831.1 hypothetical protein CHELA41_22276 [Hyphomicrobiales bacterium]MBS7741487.1 hypothetical protein [Chelatococcus sp. HY11]MBX3491202.1 hypothetical protein [Parvibaculum sp.]MBX3544494.1 hypothetical protein [Chelatococcus sp.]MCO5078983.1 hypothetical protein [Chelatococcus sp.]